MSHELRTPLNSSLILAKLLADNKDGNLTDEQVKFAADDLLGRQRSARAHQRHPRSVEDRSRQGRGRRRSRSSIARARRWPDEDLRAAGARRRGCASRRASMPGTPRAHRDRSRSALGQILKNLLVQRAQIHRARRGRAARLRRPTRRTSPSRCATPASAFRRTSRTSSSRRSARPTAAPTASTAAPAWACRSRATWRACSAATSRVQSTPGEGSIFTLTLPLRLHGAGARRACASATGARAARRAQPSRARRRGADTQPRRASAPARTASSTTTASGCAPTRALILVVEDDPRFAAILRDLAHELGFQCVVAHTASDGLAAAATLSGRARSCST